MLWYLAELVFLNKMFDFAGLAFLFWLGVIIGLVSLALVRKE